MEEKNKKYAKQWSETIPDPHTYIYGQRRRKQMIDFLETSKFDLDGWQYWMDNLTTQDPVERKFVQMLVKYRHMARQIASYNSFSTSIVQSEKSIYEPASI